MQLSNITEELFDRFGDIPIRLGITVTAVLVVCGFVSGNVIINVISWMHVLTAYHGTYAHIP